MFKGSKVEYNVSKMDFDEKTEKYDTTMRSMEITVKADTEDEAYFLFHNLVNYIEERTNNKLDVAECPTIENCNNHVEYYDIIGVWDKDEYDKLKDLYKEWKKLAKTLVMPVKETQVDHNSTEMVDYNEDLNRCINELTQIVKNNNGLTFDRMSDSPIYPVNQELTEEFTDELGFDEQDFLSYLIRRSEILDTVLSDEYQEMVISCRVKETVKTLEVEIQESTITEAPVCNNETTENNTEVATTTEATEPNTQETNHVNNSNVTITEPVTSLPSYTIHTEPVDNPFAIGRIIRVDLYNNAAITDIQELNNYELIKYQEGHVDNNGRRQVTYWKIIDIKSSIPTITESNNTVEQKQNTAIYEFKKGDRVEHKNMGKGTFIEYYSKNHKSYYDSCIVQFDENSNAKGETLEVTLGMLKI